MRDRCPEWVADDLLDTYEAKFHAVMAAKDKDKPKVTQPGAKRPRARKD